MSLLKGALLFGVLCICSSIYCQDTTALISSRYAGQVAMKAQQLESRLDRHTSRLLQKFQRQEKRLLRKIIRKDSTNNDEILVTADKHYQKLRQKLTQPGELQRYIPSLDSLTTSFAFLQQHKQLLAGTNAGEQIQSAVTNLSGLKNGFQKAEVVSEFLNERKQVLRNLVQGSALTKQFRKLNKRAYYYNQQVNEYKELLKDHRKASRKALELLGRTSLFKNFMKRNGMLARFFPMPGSGAATVNSPAAFSALQTRGQLGQMIQQFSSNPTVQNTILQRNISDAQGQLNEIRSRLAGLGGGGGDLDMPDFKPNTYKTKSFLKRLEWGVNFQTLKTNRLFPSTSDLGLSIGYKLNDRSVVGLGASYKMSFGSGWRDISFRSQGVSVRSFIEWKIKGSFWLAGGYERNYMSEFRKIDELKNLDAWQQSGLIGLSKQLSMSSRVMKKIKFQLLWDFLSYRQEPRTRPLIFRIGYTF